MRGLLLLVAAAAAAAAGGVGGGGLKGPGQGAAGKYSGAEARYIADASMEWARFEGLTMPVGHRRRGRHHAIALDARRAEAHGAAAKKRRAAAVAAAAGHEQHRRAVAEARGSSAGTAKIESKGKGVKQHRGDQHAHASSRGSKLASSSSSGKKQLADVGDEHAEDEGGSESGPHVFNPREAAGTLQGYMAQHPDFASSALAWVVVGSVLFFVAILVLIFSEVRVVLVVRDQDFRTNMSKRGYMHETDKLSELELREQDTVAARPYLTAGSMVIQFVACVCFLKPFCDVLDIIGIPSSNCFLTVSFGSFVGAVCVTTFFMGLCWSCTRGWAALVLLSISVAGNVLCTTGSPLLVVIWLVVGGGGFFYYFLWLPDREDVPEWCQSIGPIKASMDPEEWKKAAASGARAGLADLQSIGRSVPVIGGAIGSSTSASPEPKPAPRAQATV